MMTGVLTAIPSSVAALELLGQAFLEGGRHDDAVTALRTALLGNEKADLYLLLGEAELRRGRFSGAREAFRRVVEVDTSSDRGWAALGLIAARAGDLASARESLERALQLNGTLFAARVVRAQIALTDGDPAEAARHLRHALQVRPEDPWANGWLGMALLNLDDAASARDRLRLATAAGEPGFAIAYAEALRRSGDPAGALAALPGGDHNGDAALVHAAALLDLRRPAEAQAALAKAAPSRDRAGAAAYLDAAAAHQRGEWIAAIAGLERALGLPGSPAFAAEVLARVYAAAAATALMESSQEIR
jgi:Flp pilus assembly protein TadD